MVKVMGLGLWRPWVLGFGLDHHNSKIRLKYYFVKLLYQKLLCTFVVSINLNIAHASTLTKILLELHILLKWMIIMCRLSHSISYLG